MKGVIAIVAVLLTAGCGGDPSGETATPAADATLKQSSHLDLFRVRNSDGRMVDCAVYHNYVGVGISCDWGNPR